MTVLSSFGKSRRPTDRCNALDHQGGDPGLIALGLSPPQPIADCSITIARTLSCTNINEILNME